MPIADAVSDRDSCSTLSGAIAFGHLSRFAEEIVNLDFTLVGLVRLRRQIQSRLVDHPQKRNPMPPNWFAPRRPVIVPHRLLIVMKGLPLAYQKDCRKTSRRMEASRALAGDRDDRDGGDIMPDEARMKAPPAKATTAPIWRLAGATLKCRPRRP